MILPKSSLRLISLKYSRFWLTKYFIVFGGRVLEQTETFLWVPTVPLFSPTCSYNICPFLRQAICIYVNHSFIWNTVELILLIWLFASCGSSCVEDRKVKCFNSIAWGERSGLCVCLHIFRNFKYPHLIILEILIDKIFYCVWWTCFGTDRDIPMGTNCAPLLADLFLYSHEADFIQWLLTKHEKKPATW
jgi:hypothetical protein